MPSIAAAKKREDECLERGVHGLQRLGQTKLIVIEETTAGSQEEDVHNEMGAEYGGTPSPERDPAGDDSKSEQDPPPQSRVQMTLAPSLKGWKKTE